MQRLPSLLSTARTLDNRNMIMELTTKEKKTLKGLAHGLSAYAHAGKEGVTDSFIEEIRRTLNDHELIKIKISADDRSEFQGLAEEICEKAGASLVGTIGRMAIVFKESSRPDKRKHLLG
jgi:RNA-binding protein